jgi:hypothetical protein
LFGGEFFLKGMGDGAEIQNQKLNSLSRAIISYLYFRDYLLLEDSTLGIRLGHFRYGYSLLGALERDIRTAQIPGK